jgi:predicted TIM-barrel fold metal-dependent hydrolase
MTAEPGIRGVQLGQYPSGGLDFTDDDERFFAEAAAAGIPVSIHVAFATGPQGDISRGKLRGDMRFFDAPVRVAQLIGSGIFDRHPDLQIVLGEVDCGWVPYVKEQIDNNYSRLDAVSGFGLQMLPSEYIERHFHYGFMTDTVAIDNRQRIGVERILWSSDYPHISSDWPNSWRTIQAAFSGVPVAEKQAILAGNALRLYGFDR